MRIWHHFGERQRLVNGNLKVTMAWHRNDGPELRQTIFRLIQHADQNLPIEFNGRPPAEYVHRVLLVMESLASRRLSADLTYSGMPRVEGVGRPFLQ